MQLGLGGVNDRIAKQLVGLLSDRLAKSEGLVIACILQGMATEGIAIQLGVKPARAG